ncbi:histidine protein methyltransferase 1 homolog [Rhynchophorus ferrugineus]|uniref:histidine protein methyltransferase 1 homolog n=1 Tax=Rhynchophorus ferrugineus TaxID=354439 RepID=UPI003FCEE1B8
MFKFNFSRQDSDESNVEKTEEKSNRNWLECIEVLRDTNEDTVIQDIFANCEVNTLQCSDINIEYFATVDVLNIFRTSDNESIKKLSVMCADESHSDLQESVYEGGMKIWECTFDLINYLVEDKVPLEGRHVLDLGCGAGLIGLLCLRSGCSCTFQDYNVEVLKYVTMSNVQLNDEEYCKKCKFYSGDWDSFADYTRTNEKYDYIFTSETIYNSSNYSKLHNVFNSLLKPDGVIYVAAKSYYFGVGGSISLFEDYIVKENKFKSSVCWSNSDGVNRKILKITFA